MKFSPPLTQVPAHPIGNRRRSGMALVVTLALLVLVTIAAMAFFARATANRTVEASRANQVLASQLSQTAQDYVIGRFLKEIPDNAKAFTTNGVTVYQVTNAVGMVPQKLLASGISAADATNTFANLVRQSVPSADPNASTENSAQPANNGRLIGTDRWNTPQLNFGAGFSSTNQLPNWIYVNRDGSATNTATTNAIGRFAYNVYETGGLLDANVAGHPSSVTNTDLQAIKGTLAGADLTALGLSQQAIDDLVSFRNPQSGTNASAYTNYVAGAARTGFLKTVVTNGSGSGTTTNNFFTSRHDLIRYAETQNTPLTNALPYLTHSARSSAAPSWGPSTPAGSSIDYAANADNAASANRYLPTVRVKAPFTRADGTQAKVGEPLIQSRFPLSRLAGLGWNGVNTSGNTTITAGIPSPASDTTIQRDFGLRWDNTNNQWEYVGHSGTTIQDKVKTLEEVASENREPNFFELLKAGILSGSLGQSPGHAFLSNHRYDINETRHILAIGANIIDQFDADDAPTLVNYQDTFNDNQFVAGIENLPYIDEIHVIGTNENQNWSDNNRNTLLSFEIWNPHKNSATKLYGDDYILPALNQVENIRIRAVQGSLQTDLSPRNSAKPSLATTVSTAWLDVNASADTKYDRPIAQLQRPDGTLVVDGQSAGDATPQSIAGQQIDLDLAKRDWWQNSINVSSYVASGGTITGARSYMNTQLRMKAIGDSDRTNIGKPAWLGFYAGTWNLKSSSTEPTGPSNQRRWYWAVDPSSPLTGVTGRQYYFGFGDPFPTVRALNTASPATRPVFELQYRATAGGTWRPYQRFEVTSSEVPGINSFPAGSSYAVKSDPRTFRFGASPSGPMVPEDVTSATNFTYPEIYNSGESGLMRPFSPLLPPRIGNLGFSSDEASEGSPIARRDTTANNNPTGTATRYHDTTLNHGFSANRAYQEGSSSVFNSVSDASVSIVNEVNTPATTWGYPRPTSDVRSSKLLFPAEFWENSWESSKENISRYKDPDGVARQGDGGAQKTTEDQIHPSNPWNKNESRPVILNRPFQSQADLGYAFRDIPWRSLDFSSKESADSALIDLFAITESPVSDIAGKVNINTAPNSVLQSILQKQSRLEKLPAATYDLDEISSTDAQNFADQIVQKRTLNGFIVSPPQFVENYLGLINFTTQDLAKDRREAIARALSNIAQTRTWVLFLDLVAQTGMVSGNSFKPDGERRTWAVLSIDRLTGAMKLLSVEDTSMN